MKDKLLAISIICLSFSLIIAASIIGRAIKTAPVSYFPNGLSVDLRQPQQTTNEKTYNLQTAAEYLGIAEFQLKSIIDDEHNDLPYTKVGDTYIFSKGALDKWLEVGPRKINLKTNVEK
ncbi:DNA-binding protein [Clostridium intestinale]|uniref:DNA-binding protein n=1 Tax=Clostridium intestinale TaxID=36845 RepID=A0A7D6VT31_9CLOT|nr:DNA-binding protein [Clostridium intestinale]QLY78452.1 DNA-binding protein [Clostridium intestinale]